MDKLCTSGLVDDATMCHNQRYGRMLLPAQQCHCSVKNGLTSLLHGTGCGKLAYAMRDGTKTRRVFHTKGARDEVCDVFTAYNSSDVAIKT